MASEAHKSKAKNRDKADLHIYMYIFFFILIYTFKHFSWEHKRITYSRSAAMLRNFYDVTTRYILSSSHLYIHTYIYILIMQYCEYCTKLIHRNACECADVMRAARKYTNKYSLGTAARFVVLSCFLLHLFVDPFFLYSSPTCTHSPFIQHFTTRSSSTVSLSSRLLVHRSS